MKLSLIALVTTTLLVVCASVVAIPITLSFTAEQFPDTNNIAAPNALVAGTIVYEAADIHAPIDSITSIVLRVLIEIMCSTSKARHGALRPTTR